MRPDRADLDHRSVPRLFAPSKRQGNGGRCGLLAQAIPITYNTGVSPVSVQPSSRARGASVSYAGAALLLK
jgi:hypothetical protein